MKVRGFWSSPLNGFLAERNQSVSPYLAYGQSYCFGKPPSQGHKRDDLVLIVKNDIKQDCQDNDSNAVDQCNQIAYPHHGKVF